MKNILLSLLLLFFSISTVFAQEELTPPDALEQEETIVPETIDQPSIAQDTDSIEPFTVELYVDPQSAWTGKVPLIVRFRANMDAPKTEITWDSPTGVSISPSHPRFVSSTKGEVYTYKAFLSPNSQGSYNIAVNVTAWQVQTNYTSSASSIVAFDSDLKVTPQTAEYTSAVLVRNVVLGFLAILVLVGLGYLGKIAFEKFKEWIKPPQ